jgi:predicted Holliday junction resolvase-like endonuclease
MSYWLAQTRLVHRVKELEQELDSEQRRLGDATKNFRKADRGIKEYSFRQEEDRKNAERMTELVDRMQDQVFKKYYYFSIIKVRFRFSLA